LIAFSISPPVTIASEWQPSISLKIAVKQFCTDVRNSRTLDPTRCRTRQSESKIETHGVIAPHGGPAASSSSSWRHAQGIEAQLLPLERLIVDEISLTARRVDSWISWMIDVIVDELNVLELLEVELERNAPWFATIASTLRKYGASASPDGGCCSCPSTADAPAPKVKCRPAALRCADLRRSGSARVAPAKTIVQSTMRFIHHSESKHCESFAPAREAFRSEAKLRRALGKPASPTGRRQSANRNYKQNMQSS